MKNSPVPFPPELSRPEDFLSPEERWSAIAEILAEMALRALKNDDETQSTNS